MRPLFAIAPLAGLLALIDPTPHDAHLVLAGFKARLLPSDTAVHQVQPERKLAPMQPGLYHVSSPLFTANQSRTTSFEATVTGR